MKKLSLLFVLSLFFISCEDDKKQADDKDIAKNVKEYSIEQIMDNERVFGGSFSSDKSKLLITSNRSGIYNMYTVPTKGGDYTPITESDSTSIYSVSFFPEDDRILYRMDNNGDEIFHLYIKNIDGTSTELTPKKGARASFYKWAKNKKSFYYQSNERDSRYMDLYEIDLKTFTPKLIYKNEKGYNIENISDDKNYLALSKSINTNDSDLFVYTIATKKFAKVNTQQSANSAEEFSSDNSVLYYTTDANAEFSYLMKYNFADEKREIVLKKSWDINGSYVTDNGTYRVTYSNEDAKNAIEITNASTGEKIDLPDFKDQSITNVGFSRDETKMRLYVGGSNTPSDLYVYDLASKDLLKLTSTLNKTVELSDLVTAKVIRYKSFDGTVIPAIYYVPHQASATEKVPALVWVHGGPGGQSTQSFNPLIQYLTNHGYAVLAVNNRGSSGYGKTFYKMDDLNHGEGDLQDCVEGKNWLASQDEIDGDKIGIIGGSYGGYMTMAALTYAPEEFDVGVNIFGVTNWVRTLKNIPPWWESFKDALYLELGNPHTVDSVRLKRISPLFHTDKVTKPLMVLQGAKDPRVLQIESDEIVAGVKKNGVPVEYVLFEDEGHGFVKKENQIEANSRILKFLDMYLKKEEPFKN
ncbi:Dipeptidyl aminopeptidase BIII [Kordia antarctica]|uniref:Dipeptidyl aminopeptidase BIII n=1 Tax=Kordia antarctica TaxID=1218801 RepID=A0A7L4ZR08_9FLAO|nr:alpha/beta fold hydrolase [Kordia antarctica]QHI39143.1 Dipeptidyl aminopeptidase BIII [Kordia antarctica]